MTIVRRISKFAINFQYKETILRLDRIYSGILIEVEGSEDVLIDNDALPKLIEFLQSQL